MDGRIATMLRRCAAEPSVIALGGGLPARQLFPRRALSESFLRVMQDPAAPALQYGWPEGRERLRSWVADRLRGRGADVEAQDVIITSGAQQAIALAAEVSFQPGAHLACDAESYSSALSLFRGRRLVPTTNHEGAAGFYVMPVVSNPHGRGMAEDARRDLLRRARRTHAPILEDDAYAELRFEGPPPRPLLADDRTQVWHVGTFSKTLFPGLRIGWLVPPRRARARVLEAKNASDLETSALSQVVLEDLLEHLDYEALVSQARRFYARRARHLARALARRLPDLRFAAPAGGFSLWAETSYHGDEASLLERAIHHGVSFDPGSAFQVTAAGKPVAMRLSFSSETIPRLLEGVERLARAVRAFGRGARGAASAA